MIIENLGNLNRYQSVKKKTIPYLYDR